MIHSSAYTRREFVNGSLAVISTACAVPMFIQNSASVFAARPDGLASKPGFPEDRILVVIELAGGNDGLNTVVPYGDRQYHISRPRLRILEDQVLTVDEKQGIGLHPNLADVKALMDDGLGAVIQGVGYPNPNRSHFASMDIWHTADPSGTGYGWIGKAMDHAMGASGASGTECICVQRKAPLAAQGKIVRPIAFENAQMFQWVGKPLGDGLGPAYDQINRAGDLLGDHAKQPVDSQQAFLMRTALDAQMASDQIRGAVSRGVTTQFPRGALANQLRMVASMIRSELPTNVYYTAFGGFDTHANQSNRHANNLQQLAASVRAFYKELKAIGQDQRVLTLVFSEFGRRVAQNASNGTDHGAAGPMFLFGPMVKPGLIGEHPSLNDLDKGDLKYRIDFRSVYSSVLKNWFKTDAAKVLGKSFKPIDALNLKVTA